MSLAPEQWKGQELAARNKPGATKKLPRYMVRSRQMWLGDSQLIISEISALDGSVSLILQQQTPELS